jgi:hypothetical protein
MRPTERLFRQELGTGFNIDDLDEILPVDD